jgi:hypothetical protein
VPAVNTGWRVPIGAAIAAAMGGLATLDDLLELLPPSLPSPVAGILERCEALVTVVPDGARADAWQRLWSVLARTIEHYPTDVSEGGVEVPDVAFVAGRAPLRERERQLLMMVASGTPAHEGLAEHGAAVPDGGDALADLCRVVAVSAWLAGWGIDRLVVELLSDG